MRNLLFLSLVAFLASCSSARMNSLSTPMYAPMAQINPIRADVTIDKNKVLEGEASRTYFLFLKIQGEKDMVEGMVYSGEGRYERQAKNLAYLMIAVAFPPAAIFLPFGLEDSKSAAAYKAVANSGADILVHPNYVVTKQNYLFFRKIKVRVRGYAGYFKDFYQEEYCDPCTGKNEAKPKETSSTTPSLNVPSITPSQDVQPQPTNNKKSRKQ